VDARQIALFLPTRYYSDIFVSFLLILAAENMSIHFYPRDAMLASYLLSLLSICPSQVDVVSKQVNIGSYKQCRMIARGL